jgi:hypothetical protein
MLELKAEFDRLRAVKGQKDTVKLITTITNIGSESTAATLLIKTPFSLGLDKIGLKREVRTRINEIKPGAVEQTRTELYLKPNVKEGYIPLEIKLIEHPGSRFDVSTKTHTIELKLRVITP